MPKRKISESGDEDFIKNEASDSSVSAEESDSEKSTKTKPTKQVQNLKQKVSGKSSSNKRAKEEVKEEVAEGSATKSESSTLATVKIHTTSEGDKYIDLGKKKRATVRSFKGVPLIDIREFYGADGDEKPGKKGISLTIEQWQSLRDGMSTIDKLLDEVKKK